MYIKQILYLLDKFVAVLGGRCTSSPPPPTITPNLPIVLVLVLECQ